MNDDKTFTIRYNNGALLSLSFPTQIKNSTAALLEGLKRMMESDKLLIEAEGKLIVIPWNSVQQIEVQPAPSTLPFTTIKNASIRGSSPVESS